MKKLALWITLICVPAGAQIPSQIFFQNSVPVIGYCSVPGYPSAPLATNLQFQFKASSMSNCDGTTHQTAWADSSGNGNNSGAQSSTYVLCDANQINGLPAVDTTATTAKFGLAVVAPVMRGTPVSNSSSGNSIVVTWPTGTLAGDTAIMFVAGQNIISNPSGWTVLHNASNAANWSQGATFSKVLDSTDISNGSVTVSASGNVMVSSIAALVGTVAVQEDDVSFANAATASVSTTAAAIRPNQLLLIYGSARASALPTSNLGSLQTSVQGSTSSAGALYSYSNQSGSQTATFSYTGYNSAGYYQSVVVLGTTNPIFGSDEHTVFAMVNPTTDNTALISSPFIGFGYGFGTYNAGSGRQAIYDSGPSFDGSGTASLTDGAWHSLMGQQTGPMDASGFTALFHNNQTVDALITTSTHTNFVEPDFLFWNRQNSCCGFSGKVAEILYYNAKLSAANIVYNECYLYGKYGR